MTVAEIAAGLRHLLEENGYKDATIRVYEREWSRIEEFISDEYGDAEFDVGRGMAYLESRYGIATDYDCGRLRRQRVQLMRIVHLLEDYRLHGVLTRRYLASRNPVALKGEWAAARDAYLAALASSGLSASTARSYGTTSLEFLDYLSQRGIRPHDVDLDAVEAYVRTLAGYTYKTVEQRVCGARHLLRFLRSRGIVAHDVAARVHVPPAPRAPHIPSAWDPDDLRALLAAVDREGPLGKRDYAMMVLACVLGLRIGDIKGLRFRDFDWTAKQLSIVQRKTGRPLTLPIPDSVGWAVIDYVRNGRPTVEGDDHVFLSHRPPYGPLSDNDHLSQAIIKHMRKAGLDRRGRRSGFHSLRHTAGSMMLGDGTPLPVIASVLGHADVDVTATYLKTDLERLGECVVEPVPLPSSEALGGGRDG